MKNSFCLIISGLILVVFNIPAIASSSSVPEEALKPPVSKKVPAAILSKIPEMKGFTVVYDFNPLTVDASSSPIKYERDFSEQVSGDIERIGYYLETTDKDGVVNHVFVSMDAFTDDPKKLGIPTAENKILFQQEVKNLFVKGKAPNLTNGSFKKGNIEIWAGNYGTWNKIGIPGAANNIFDFGDGIGSTSPGHGCLQVHNFLKKQTVLAFNGMTNPVRDLGVGNEHEGENRDWTLARNSQTYKNARMLILVKTKK